MIIWLAYFTTHPIILFFFFNDTATTEIYTLSLHDALPILHKLRVGSATVTIRFWKEGESTRHEVVSSTGVISVANHPARSEEHTSELQSRRDLVCRLLLEKKKKNKPKEKHTHLTIAAPKYK